MGDQAHDPGQGGLVAGGADLDPKRTTANDGAGDDGLTRRPGHGPRLARDHRLVDVGSPLDDHPIGRHPSAGTDQDGVADAQLAGRNHLSAIRDDAFRGVREQGSKGGQSALCLGDRAHLQPVAEQHDGDQGGQFPPDLHIEQAERAGPRGHECDHDRERDQGHHPGLAVGQLAFGTADEDQAAVEENEGAENRRPVLLARECRQRVPEPLLDVRAQDDDRDRQGEAQPELVPEYRHRVASVLVVVGGGGMLVAAGRLTDQVLLRKVLVGHDLTLQPRLDTPPEYRIGDGQGSGRESRASPGGSTGGREPVRKARRRR